MLRVLKWMKGRKAGKNRKKKAGRSQKREEAAGRSDLVSYPRLRDLMGRYRTDSLKAIDPSAFRQRIDGYLNMTDAAMEQFKDPARQRDLSIKFHWGHHHDFGDFELKGRMGDRHIALISKFIDRFHAIPFSLEGKRVLDIGCWTGGTSLLLCAMGAHVVAIEEVKKYVDCLNYLKESFGIQNLDARNLSLYECAGKEFYDSFDIVLFAGVLYHVTDPVLALRIAFNCLKDGGTCLLETAAIQSERKILAYQGPSKCGKGDRKDLNRSGWNWFVPSPSALEQMMTDVGFSEVVVGPPDFQRALATAKRIRHADIMRGGLSVRNIY